jgi:hypothetical protein
MTKRFPFIIVNVEVKLSIGVTMSINTIALFDLDGVLVQPGGYRAATKAAIVYYLEQMGLKTTFPGEDFFEHLEALGISSEWDMVPISIAMYLEEVVQRAGLPSKTITLDEALAYLKQKKLSFPNLSYKTHLARIKPFLKKELSPSDAVLAECLSGQPSLIFPALSGQTLLKELLAETRWPARSRTTRLFQNHVLGSQVFRKTYSLEPILECDSYLEAYDLPLITPATWLKVREGMEQGKLGCAVYTLRPSLPAAGSGFEPLGFSPEAEMALKLVKAPTFPLIGYGQINCLAEKVHQTTDSLVKPNPVQALAAIGSAICGDEWRALQWAYQLAQPNEKSPLTADVSIEIPANLNVNVFEDSGFGIQAVKDAIEILKRSGIPASLKAWGVTASDLKAGSLNKQGAVVFRDINQAFATASEGF